MSLRQLYVTSGPLLHQGGQERTCQAQTQAQEPECVYTDTPGGGMKLWGWERGGENSSVRNGSELPRDLREDLYRGIA